LLTPASRACSRSTNVEQKKEQTFVTNEEASTRGEKISLNRAIAVIGAGNMGTSLLRGILNAKLAPH